MKKSNLKHLESDKDKNEGNSDIDSSAGLEGEMEKTTKISKNGAKKEERNESTEGKLKNRGIPLLSDGNNEGTNGSGTSGQSS